MRVTDAHSLVTSNTKPDYSGSTLKRAFKAYGCTAWLGRQSGR
jgi:hypothetical protein